jgi:Fuc2NAc and GlcNAc transferase
MEFLKHYVSIAIMALLCGAAGAYAIKNIGHRSGLMDKPDNRSSHHVPTPKGGGIGILISFIAGSVWLGVNTTFMLIIVAVSILGLLSDRMDISPKKRLLIQFLGASGIILFTYENGFASPDVFFILPIAGCVFIVGTSNFYNFMDGINGIAGITAIVAYGLCGYYFSAIGHNDSYLLLIGFVICSVIGFLPFNIPNASVFMGDVGSILLGFLYASIIVVTSRTTLDFVCTASFLFLFYADELTTMVIRIRDGDSLLAPHRRHLYQIFANELGCQHWIVSAGYGIVQLLIGISVLFLVPHGIEAVLALLTIYFIAFAFVTVRVRRHLIA